jgi:hypothetical protein
MCDIDELDELEDFDIVPAKYELWVLGYDSFDRPTGFSTLVNTFENPDEAISVATRITLTDLLNKEGVETCDYLVIEVDTVIMLDEQANAGTIYKRYLEFEKPAIDLRLTFADYELTELCDLKIKGTIADPFKVGDYLNAIVGEERTPVRLKVYSKETNFILCEFID